MQHNLIGKTIGQYHLIEELGAGGMASIYRARRTADNREVAIKILPIHLAANETLRQRFMREARMASRLQHPYILPVYDFGEDDSVPFIVMKLIDGGTLADLIRYKGPLPIRVVARVLTQVADALDYAHDQGVIHRDIKPENILFESNGHAYLGDFGIARIHEATGELTGQGGFLGTAAYASPEQCRGEELTSVSDIYSLGIVLYEMLTGTQPFEGSTPLAVMHQQISEPPPNPLKYRPELPVEITDVIRKALTKLPQVRYQSARAMCQSFHVALRRELGTQPFAENAPPIGPNPVFDKPTGTYASLSIPDELLRDASPSLPTPPARRTNERASVSAADLRANPNASTVSLANLYVLLFLGAVFVIISAIALLTLVD
jgi:serine/threonine protein kinase